MPGLNIGATVAVPRLAQPYASAVDLTLSNHPDSMLRAGGDQHYFSVGASALNVILAATALAQVEPTSILDFGCGAGRVTRWLRVAFPTARLSACDLREDDVCFVERRFAAATWRSRTSVAEIEKPHVHGLDLIWLGSVITHLDESTSIALLRKLSQWLNPRGLLIASLHGRGVQIRGDAGKTYLHPQGWRQIRSAYDATGYGYADYERQVGYGISLSSPEWTVALSKRLEGTRIVLFGETLWDNHHDVVALQARQP